MKRPRIYGQCGKNSWKLWILTYLPCNGLYLFWSNDLWIFRFSLFITAFSKIYSKHVCIKCFFFFRRNHRPGSFWWLCIFSRDHYHHCDTHTQVSQIEEKLYYHTVCKYRLGKSWLYNNIWRGWLWNIIWKWSAYSKKFILQKE